MTETYEDRVPMQLDKRDTHIFDLPPHILEEIVFESCKGKYSRVMLLRTERVCTLFGDMCVNLLRSGFKQLETRLKQHVHNARDEMRRKMEQNQGKNWVQTAKALSIHLFQLEALLTQLQMVKASVWSYATAEIWTFYDGGLLDRCYKVMKQLTATPIHGLYNTETVATMRQVRRESARYLKRFTKKVYRRLDDASQELTEGRSTERDINAGMVATGVALLEMLECGLDMTKTTPIIAQSASMSDQGGLEDVPKYTRLKIQYTLNNCWLGILQTRSDREPTHDEEARQISNVIRELIWISNMEHLKWQQVTRFSVIYPNASQICSTDNVLINKHTDSSFFPSSTINLTDNFNEQRLFFYGHRSRVQYHTADSSELFLSPGYDARRQFVFDHDVFNYPTNLVNPRVLIEVDITCPTELLPQGLLTCATVDKDMPVEEQYSLEMTLASCHAGNTETFRSYSFTSKELPLPAAALEDNNIVDDVDSEVKFDAFRRWQSGEPYTKVNKTA